MLSGGVLGIYSSHEVEYMAKILSHASRGIGNRGETAFGFIVGRDGTTRMAFDKYTKRGKVRELTDDKEIRRHINFSLANMAISHVHKGNVDGRYIEPIEIERKGYKLAIGIDGKILDDDLDYDLKEEFGANTDAELIGILIANEYEKTGDICGSIEGMMDYLYDRGSYSATMLFNDGEKTHGLAFRAPIAMKPLCFGKVNDIYAFSSQSTSLDLIEAKLEGFTVPGAVYMFSKGLKEPEFRQLVEGKRAECMFEYPYYHIPAGRLPGPHGPQYVLDVRNRFGLTLARIDKETGNLEIVYDGVTYIPYSGQGGGQGYAEGSGLVLKETLVKVLDALRTFDMGLDKEEEREEEIRYKFWVIITNTMGKNLAVIDDSVVYGATSKGIIQRYYRDIGKVKELHWKNTCAAKTAPCITGFDDERILAAEPYADLPVDIIGQKVAELIGADSVTYPTVEDNVQDIGVSADELCLACLTGKYPLPAAQRIWDRLKKQREKLYANQ